MEQALLDAAMQLIPVAALVLATLASWGIVILKKKINMEAGRAALDQVDKVVAAVVGDISQTTVEALKAKMEGGSLTPTYKERLKAQAIARINELISKELSKTAAKSLTDLEEYIKRRIEAQILENKGAAK